MTLSFRVASVSELLDEVVQAAPGALDALELRSMHDRVHLGGQLLVEPRDHLLDRVEDVVLDQAGVGQRLLHQRGDRVLDLGGRTFAARLEALLQQRGEFVGVLMSDFCRGGFFVVELQWP